MRKFNKNNCMNCNRDIIVANDCTLILNGIHSYEWSIIKITNNYIRSTTFANRKLALKYWNEIKKQYK